MNTVHTAEDINGDTLTELMEEHNAADFKKLCPAIKHRVKLRSLFSTAGRHEAVDACPPHDGPQQSLLTTEVYVYVYLLLKTLLYTVQADIHV